MNKKSRLGDNPLSWIGKSPEELTKKATEKKLSQKLKEASFKNMTLTVRVDFINKIEDLAYHQKLKKRDALDMILSEYFEKNKNKLQGRTN